MIFILGKVPPRVNLEQTDPRSADVESELQHTMLKERRLKLSGAFVEHDLANTFIHTFLHNLTS